MSRVTTQVASTRHLPFYLYMVCVQWLCIWYSEFYKSKFCAFESPNPGPYLVKCPNYILLTLVN